MGYNTRSRQKNQQTISPQAVQQGSTSSRQLSYVTRARSSASTDEPVLVGYFIILAGLVLTLIAIPLGVTALGIFGIFVAVFGVALMVVTDTF